MDDSRLETAFRQISGFPVIDVTGEIDLYTAPVFKKALNKTIEEGNTNILVNMSRVSYMDSSGFGTLLGITKRVRPEGGSVNLVGCNEAIQRMLRITRLNTVFGLFDAEDEAVQTLRRSQPA